MGIRVISQRWLTTGADADCGMPRQCLGVDLEAILSEGKFWGASTLWRTSTL
jgi:hypothetical protein